MDTDPYDNYVSSDGDVYTNDVYPHGDTRYTEITTDEDVVISFNTGMKDSSDRDIYEGDIVGIIIDSDDSIDDEGIVKYDKKNGCWYVDTGHEKYKKYIFALRRGSSLDRTVWRQIKPRAIKR